MGILVVLWVPLPTELLPTLLFPGESHPLASPNLEDNPNSSAHPVLLASSLPAHVGAVGLSAPVSIVGRSLRVSFLPRFLWKGPT